MLKRITLKTAYMHMIFNLSMDHGDAQEIILSSDLRLQGEIDGKVAIYLNDLNKEIEKHESKITRHRRSSY